MVVAPSAGKRVEGEAASESTARLLSSFLTEMDGLELAQGVLLWALPTDHKRWMQH
jgi:SpoVK/Ycf46/Vps4 family AAA+-type ATPase